MKRPPIEALPAGEWPRCVWCNRKLRAVTDDTYDRPLGNADAGPRVVTRRVFSFWNGYPRGATTRLFDTLSCALAFAMASYRGGFRREAKS